MIFLLTIIPVACGGGGQTQASTAGNSTGEAQVVSTARQQAAELAAQIQLINAEADEGAFFKRHQTYAPSAAALRAEYPHISTKVNVVRGSAAGFEISIQADDLRKTIYIISKTGDLIERVDGDGQPW